MNESKNIAVYKPAVQVLKDSLSQELKISYPKVNQDAVFSSINSYLDHSNLSGVPWVKLEQPFIFGIKLGLEFNTFSKQAYIVPFKGVYTFIVGYMGLIDLVIRTGQVDEIEATAVFAKDVFEVSKGSDGDSWIYKPWLGGDKGAVTNAFCEIKKSDGSVKFHFINREKIEQIRNLASSKNSPAWLNHYDEMAKKTVIRNALKYFPLSVRKIIDEVDKAEGIKIEDQKKEDPNVFDMEEVKEEEKKPLQVQKDKDAIHALDLIENATADTWEENLNKARAICPKESHDDVKLAVVKKKGELGIA